ncbi:hypothetical protein NC653_004118 [Populus alba x Populus x berolinensis]|uniref:Uncharacterized protein n=1 Tax=Populus alba x Populus x berolinensis TaxID=444605 RepID=A0AAD6RT87_9ROSI|nr:hypothetical protein NC653_004118 [Populus alba x Populus x berolinensis]
MGIEISDDVSAIDEWIDNLQVDYLLMKMKLTYKSMNNLIVVMRRKVARKGKK